MSKQGTLQDHAAFEMKAAHEALGDAELLLQQQRLTGAISRGHYAIFHASRAVLNMHDSAPITHRGVKSEFGRLLVKTEKVELEYGEILHEAGDERHVADYEVSEKDWLPTPELAQDIVAKARRFVERMGQLVTPP